MEKLYKKDKIEGGSKMETGTMKNMIILKNLPSNLVEEAIVILKSSKKAKRLEKIEKNNNLKITKETVKKEKDYLLKEAEMLVSSYIAKIENDQEERKENVKNRKNYIRLKRYAFITSSIILLQTILLILK